MKDSECILLSFRGFGLTIQRFCPGDFGGGLEDVGDKGAELGGADGLVHVAVEQAEEELHSLLAGASHNVPRHLLKRLKSMGIEWS